MDRNASPTSPAMLSWMSALADVTRLRCLRLLERQELTVADLCGVLQLPQSTVSRHLKVLADESWAAARPEGTSRLYRMSSEALDPAARRLWSLLREQVAALATSEQDDRRLASVVAARRSQSQAFFSSAAGQWDRLRHELFGERFDLGALVGLLDEDWTVGDLGCGTGQIAAQLAPFVRRVVAVESSRAMLRAARQRLAGMENVELRSGDLEALPVADRSLDAAVVCLVLHHVADPRAVLREAARALREGGRLLLIDMLRHDRVEFQRQMGHVWLGFEPPRVAAWLDEAGFERARIVPLPPSAQAKGPALFAATATNASAHRNAASPRAHTNGTPVGADSAPSPAQRAGSRRHNARGRD